MIKNLNFRAWPSPNLRPCQPKGRNRERIPAGKGRKGILRKRHLSIGEAKQKRGLAVAEKTEYYLRRAPSISSLSACLTLPPEEPLQLPSQGTPGLPHPQVEGEALLVQTWEVHHPHRSKRRERAGRGGAWLSRSR